MYIHNHFLSDKAVLTWPNEDVYGSWPEQLQDEIWGQIRAAYGDSVQLSILRALAIAGIGCDGWPDVFIQLIGDQGEWPFIKQFWFENRQLPDLDWFVNAVINTVSCSSRWIYSPSSGSSSYYQGAPTFYCFYPPVFPVWFLDYGYTQSHYIQDLMLYWSDIYPMYYHPWPGTRIGDVLSATTIKELGEQARREIGALFDLSQEYVENPQMHPDAAA